jgi:succinyl-diaminopimelate desuccinylase
MTIHIDDIVALTCDLIRFPSTADRPDQLQAVIDYAEQYLATIPNIYVSRSERNGKPALVATLHDTRTPTLILNAHLDVVAAEPQQWEPEVRDGRVYGRGSQDMKGSAAVLLRLFKSLAALEPRPNVGVQFVTDEEIGGMDGTERLANEGWHCAFFIAAEPTDLRICYSHKGGVPTEVVIPGAASHGSKPWEGRNPISVLREGLNRLNQRFPQPDAPTWITTVTPTEIHAGTGSRNQLPAEVRIAFDIRYIPGDTPEMIVETIRECFPGAEVTYRWTPPLNTDPDVPAVQHLAKVVRDVRGVEPEFFREHFGTDARFYGAVGIPAVCIGPTGAGLHQAVEWVDIDSLGQLYGVFERLSMTITAR